MKNNQTQDYDEDIAFNIVEKNKIYNNHLDESEYSQENEEILNNIKKKQHQDYKSYIYSTYVNNINYSSVLQNKRYSLNTKKYTDKNTALKFISILFLLALSVWLIVSSPSLPSAGVAKGKYYIFEDYEKGLEIQHQNQILLSKNKKGLNNITSATAVTDKKVNTE